MPISPTNQTKSSVISPTNQALYSATMVAIVKSGFSWLMGQSDITMGMATYYDGRTVYMGTLGSATSFTNQTKS